MPDRFGIDPARRAEAAGALAEVRRVVPGGAVMSEPERLGRFLRTGPLDVGCDEAMAVLHVYVELMAAGEDVAGRYPGVAARLLACGPCDEDFTGLLAAVTDG